MEIWDLTNPADLGDLHRQCTPPFGRPTTFRNVCEYACSFLQATHALLEDPYIDRDFRTELAIVYSRKFRTHQTRSRRLHFFRAPGHAAPCLANLLEQQYLGYTILRPLQARNVGRTALQVPTAEDVDLLIPCSSHYQPHLNEHRLGVTATMFAQQDGAVMSCAHVVVWMAARELTKRRLIPWISPARVAETAFAGMPSSGRPFPTIGLYPHQVVVTMSQLGLNPVVSARWEEDEEGSLFDPVGFLGKNVLSGYPVAVGVPDHMILAIGVVLDRTVPIAPLARGQAHHLSKYMLGAVIHDDSLGPYRILPCNAEARERLKASSVRDLLVPEGSRYRSFHDVDILVAPTPERTHISAEYLDTLIDTLLLHRANRFVRLVKSSLDVSVPYSSDFLAATLGEHGQGFVYWAHLVEGSYLKQRLCQTDQRFPPEVLTRLLAMPMPRFVWYCEYTTTSHIASTPFPVIGSAVLDSTACEDVPCHLLVHVPGAVLLRDADSDKESVVQFQQSQPVWRDTFAL